MIMTYVVLTILPLVTLLFLATRSRVAVRIFTWTYAASLLLWAAAADFQGTASIPGVLSISGVSFLTLAAVTFAVTGICALDETAIWSGLGQIIYAAVLAISAAVLVLILAVTRHSLLPIVAFFAVAALAVISVVMIGRRFTPASERS